MRMYGMYISTCGFVLNSFKEIFAILLIDEGMRFPNSNVSIMCQTPFTSFSLHWNSPNAIGSSEKPGARWQTTMPKNVSNSSTRGRIRCGLVTLLGFLIVAISLLLTEPAKVSGDYHTPPTQVQTRFKKTVSFNATKTFNPVKQSITSYHSGQFSLLQRSNKNYSSKYAGLFLLQMRKKYVFKWLACEVYSQL